MNTAERALAVQDVLSDYRGTAFAWGERDCLQMTRNLFVKLGAEGLPKIPKYTSELTAIRRLKEAGHDNLESLLSDYCISIPTSWAMLGDLGIVKGHGALPAIIINSGSGWLGWPDGFPVFSEMRVKPDMVFRYV